MEPGVRGLAPNFMRPTAPTFGRYAPKEVLDRLGICTIENLTAASKLPRGSSSNLREQRPLLQITGNTRDPDGVRRCQAFLAEL
jgi:hypothetical protein